MEINNLREFIALWIMKGDDAPGVLDATDQDEVANALDKYAIWVDMQLPNNKLVFKKNRKLSAAAIKYLRDTDEDQKHT